MLTSSNISDDSSLIAALRTQSTHIEVIEGGWSTPISNDVTLQRPTITWVQASPGCRIDAQYPTARSCHYQRVGDVVFTPSNIEVRARAARKGQVRVVTCSYEPSYFEDATEGVPPLSESQLISCFDIRGQFIEHGMMRLMHEALRPGFASAAIVESLGRALLFDVLQIMLGIDQYEPQGRLTSQHLRAIHHYVAGLKYQIPRVADVATLCGCSERHLARLFRDSTGQSIGRFLRSAQLAKAQRHLIQTDLSLKEIAHLLGFAATSAFSAAFRAAVGETPNEFRTKARTQRSIL